MVAERRAAAHTSQSLALRCTLIQKNSPCMGLPCAGAGDANWDWQAPLLISWNMLPRLALHQNDLCSSTTRLAYVPRHGDSDQESGTAV